MALPLPPFNPYNPVPNNPFYTPQSNYIKGEYSPFILGSGFSLNNNTGVISVSGGGGGGTGTVTSVATGVGLTGGPITTSGTISLTNTGVTAGSYTYPDITVDAQGRITAVTSGTTPNTSVTAPITNSGTALQPIIGISAATTTALGAVQVGSNIQVSAGVISVTPASTTQVGVSRLATNAETQTGTDATIAVTPQGAAATYIPLSKFTAKGDLISGSSASVASTLSLGTDGYILSACSACVGGLAWAAPTAVVSAIPCSCITGKGALIAGLSSNTPTALAVGTDGYILTACSTCITGLTWSSPALAVPAIPCACVTGKGALVTGTAANTPSALAVGTDGQVLTACAACASGLTWAAAGGGGAPVATPGTFGTVYGRTCQGGAPGGNTSVGFGAFASTSVGCQTAFGLLAGSALTSGICNIAIGSQALQATLTGSFNTFVGSYSGTTAQNITGNVAIGASTGVGLTNATGNVIIGYNSMTNGNQGASCNVVIGCGSGSLISSGSRNIAIGGINDVFPISTENDRISMGQTTTTNAYIKVAWTVTSDARDKVVRGPVPHGMSFIEQLNPIAYQFKVARDSDQVEGPVRYGFLAQDVLALEGNDPVIIDTETPETLRYNGESLVPVLVNALKELNVEMKSIRQELADVKAQLAANG